MTYIGSFKESTQTPQSTLNTDSEISVPAAYLLNHARDIFSRMGYRCIQGEDLLQHGLIH